MDAEYKNASRISLLRTWDSPRLLHFYHAIANAPTASTDPSAVNMRKMVSRWRFNLQGLWHFYHATVFTKTASNILPDFCSLHEEDGVQVALLSSRPPAFPPCHSRCTNCVNHLIRSLHEEGGY